MKEKCPHVTLGTMTFYNHFLDSILAIININENDQKRRHIKVAKHKTQRTYKMDSVGFAHMMEKAIKNIKSGNMIYIAFSKKSFYALLFTIGMAIIANVILAYLLVIYPIWTWDTGMFMYIALFLLCIATILSGLYLIFKGIDIVTDDEDFI